MLCEPPHPQLDDRSARAIICAAVRNCRGADRRNFLALPVQSANLHAGACTNSNPGDANPNSNC